LKFLTEHNLLIFLIQFALLLTISKLVGLLFEKYRQPTLTGEVLVGLILGPAIFGKYLPMYQQWLFPRELVQISMLETIAWLGNFYLLMEIGLGVNFGRIWKQRGQAVTIAMTDLIVPILLVFVPIYLLPDIYLVDPSQRLIFSLFIATIMTISALPVAIKVMHDLNILKSDTGFLIVSALTINDLIGWVVFTIILGIFGHSMVNFTLIARLVVLTLGFTIISLTLLKNLVDKIMTLIHRKSGADSGLKTTFVFVVGMLFGAITLRIGIHSLFGFLIAGIVLGETKHFSENDRHVMNRIVHSVFIPVFFTNIGLHLDILKNFHWELVLLFTVLGMGARYIGAYLGAKLARQDKSNLMTIAICHTAGGEMHIVVAILALASGLITESIFVGIVAASLISTTIFGPWLARTIRKRRKGLLKIMFSPDSIILDTEFTDRQELISYVGKIIARRLHLEAETVLEEINKREEQMSTAMGKGFAFPHARLGNISLPLIFVVKNNLGLEWDSPDNKPVRWVFFIITPESHQTAQLNILQMLARTLSNIDILHQMQTTRNPEVVWELISPNLENCEKNIQPA
jgi:Kef-type K+ transport system membrane component KefB/mannitol/fructose-specific phosphotransferase system IIA component (Ntr-type)